jgi:transcriptional regulator GlxA family with amidase domain
MLLGAAGLLDGRRATTHWRSLDWMREALPAVRVDADRRVVEDGGVYTSAGISAGIDMALTLVARWHGQAIAEATARHMEYAMPADDLRSRA